MKMNLRTLRAKLLGSKRAKVIASVIATAAILTTTGTAFAGWSPDRPVFDWNNPSQQVGSTTGPVFNSFINTPYYGDERAFFDAANSDNATQTGAFKDNLTVPSTGSKEVTLRMYVHNNGNQSLNGNGVDGKSVAHDTSVHITLPTGTETALRARAYIDASNATPTEVTDTADLTSNSAFSISYVPGSAVIFNGAHTNGLALSDNIVAGGDKIGYKDMDGNFPGCFSYQSVIEIKVKVNTPTQKITKQVRKAGITGWNSSATVNVGDKENWLIGYTNTGAVNQDKVAVWDQLPPHLKVVPGSVKLVTVNNAGQTVNTVQSNTDLFTGYDNFGTWNPNGGFYLMFDTTAQDDFTTCTVTSTNIAHVHSTQSPNDITANADVTINKQNCTPPTPPAYTCDLLDINKVGADTERTVNIKSFVTTQTDTAPYKDVVIDWGDKSAPLTTNTAVGQTHQYAAYGTYTVTATAHFTVNGKDITATSANCAKPVTFTAPGTPVPPTPPVTTVTTPPTTLVNTGAGSVLGIFAAAMIVGTLAHRFFTSRRLTREI
jgi:uncharacterized repeat protein (TIGR01451 family)